MPVDTRVYLEPPTVSYPLTTRGKPSKTPKYRAWQHQLALTILAAWFVADTRLDWMRRFQQDPTLLKKYEVEVLPQ